MKKKDLKEIVVTAVSLLLICAFASGLVAAVNAVTHRTIEDRAAEEAAASRRELLPEAVDFPETALENGEVYYTGKTASGEVAGYVFVTTGNGYNGQVKVMTGFTPAGEVTGVSFLTLDETPGLGMNAKRPDFYSQFTGTSGKLRVVKNADPGENEVRAITSATVTSNAVTSAVNAARELFDTVAKGGDAQ